MPDKSLTERIEELEKLLISLATQLGEVKTQNDLETNELRDSFQRNIAETNGRLNAQISVACSSLSNDIAKLKGDISQEGETINQAILAINNVIRQVDGNQQRDSGMAYERTTALWKMFGDVFNILGQGVVTSAKKNELYSLFEKYVWSVPGISRRF